MQTPPMVVPASLKISLGVLLLLSVSVFGFGCFLFSGIGICGSSFSLPVFSVIFTATAALSGGAGWLMPKAWFGPGLIFMPPAALGLLVTVLSGDWLRTITILLCIGGAFGAGYLGARPAADRRRWARKLVDLIFGDEAERRADPEK